MADNVMLTAEPRDRIGKGASRAVRKAGRIPAVIYGDKQDPIAVSLTYKDVVVQVNTGTFLSSLVDVDVNGEKFRTIPKDVQFDPVRDFIMHVDFLRLGKDARVNVEVLVNFLNEEESPGLVRGGVLNVVRYQVELSCPAEDIPDGLDADLTGLDIGDSIHISDISLPEGVEPTITDRDFTIATIAAPVAEEVEPSEEDEEEFELLEGEEGIETEGEAESDGEGDGGE